MATTYSSETIRYTLTGSTPASGWTLQGSQVASGYFDVTENFTNGVWSGASLAAVNISVTGGSSSKYTNTFTDISKITGNDTYNIATPDRLGASISNSGQYFGVHFENINSVGANTTWNDFAIGFNDASAKTYGSDGASVAQPNITFNGMLYHSAINSGYTTDAAVGTYTLTESIVCYAKGTLITTEHGPVAVEKLKVGDQVLTVSGQYEPVKWLGHRRINCKRQANPAQAWPVRVAKDAFGLGLPTRDLILSPGHAVLVDGHLVPIIHLTNGITITQEPWSKVTYYHVELPSHNAIYAEGLPAETYLDDNNRKFFLEANSQAAVVDLDTPFSEERSQANWAQYGFAPMVSGGPVLEAIRTQLLTRLAQSGYELTASQEELSLLVDGQTIPFLRTPAGVLAWIPAGVSELSIQSNHFVPGHIYANSFDGRRLGVSVSEVRLGNKAIALDDAALTTGWHAIESQYEMAEQTQGKAAYNWRWTDGNATLKLERNACALEITLEGTAKANWQAKTQEDSQHHNVLKAAA